MYRRLHRYQNAGLVNINPENTLEGEQVYEAPYSLPEVVISDKLDRTNPTAVRNYNKANNPIAYASQETANKFASDYLMPIAENAPGTGDAMDAAMLLEAIDKKDYGTLGMAGLATVLPGVTIGGLKAGRKLVNKFRGKGKKTLEKAGLTQPRLSTEGRPITQEDVDLNRTVSRSEIEDHIDLQDRMLEEQIEIIERDEMMGTGYMSPEAQDQIDIMRGEIAEEANTLRDLADAGGIRIQGSRGIVDGVTDRGILPEGIARKANPQNRGEVIQMLNRESDGSYDVINQPAVSVGTNRNPDQVRQSSAILRQFDGPFGKETTRVNNPFSGESVRYQDIPGNFEVSGTGIQGLDSKPRVQKITQKLKGAQNNKDAAKKLISGAADALKNFSPKRAYRMAQEKEVIGGDSWKHVILPSYTPSDPTGSKYAMRKIRETMDKVSSVPGSRFQDADMSTDSFPLVLKSLTKGSMSDKFKVKTTGEFVPLNSFGYGGDEYFGPNRVFKGELLPGYDPNQLGDVISNQGKVVTYGAEGTVEMINEKIRALNKAQGTSVPMARYKDHGGGYSSVEVPLIFADAKFETKGGQRVLDESKAWIKRNPKNIKRAAKTALVGDAILGGAATYRYATRNEDE